MQLIGRACIAKVTMFPVFHVLGLSSLEAWFGQPASAVCCPTTCSEWSLPEGQAWQAPWAGGPAAE